jgi:hypothetical protein
MATTRDPIDFILNRSTSEAANQVVTAPAFSLTKVLASAAIIIGPIATLVVDKLSKSVNLTGGSLVALALGLLGFLAITASADVLARAWATAAEKNAAGAEAGRGRLVRFATPIDGHRIDGKTNPDVVVIGFAQGNPPRFLVVEGTTAKWLRQSELTLG